MFNDILTHSARPLEAKSVLPAIVFVGVALVAGGAGIGNPLNATLIELLAIAMIVRVACARVPERRGWTFAAILALFVAAIALALVQLVPLPPTLWRSLPGRALASEIYRTLGWNARWHALSLTPDRTLFDMLALLPALAAFLLVALLSERKRALLLRTVVGTAMLGTALGALQVASGEAAPMLYDTIHRGFGVGFFVNRNHQAALLLVAIILAALPHVMVWPRGAPAQAARSRRAGHRDAARASARALGSVAPGSAALALPLASIAFLALGVLATGSRTGLALLPLAVIVALGLCVQSRGVDPRWSAWRRYAVPAGLLLYGAAGVALYPTALVQTTLARFAAASEDLRYQYWENSRFAIGTLLPWGSGFGSFDTVYRTVEPLGQVAPVWVNHAHNDYLELVLEGGVAAILLLGVMLAVVAAAFVSVWWRAPTPAQRSAALAGGAGVALLLLCSVVDFSLRMAAVSVPFGMLLGLAVPPVRAARASGGGATDIAPVFPRLLGTAALLLVAAIAGWLALSGGAALALVQSGQPDAATRLAPWVADGWSERANREARAGRLSASSEAAQRALGIAPLDAAAVRAVGMAELAQRQPARGTALLQLGAALGWRDTPTQLWLVQQALQVGNLPIAVERIDGLLRRGVEPAILQRQLRAIFVAPGGVAALVARLAHGAPWRQGFLNAIADDGPGAPRQLAALLAAVRAAGVPATSAETSLIRWRLADAGDFAGARQMWRATGGVGWLADGDFAQSSSPLPAQAAPYAWAAPPSAGVQLAITEPEPDFTPERGARGRTVTITTAGYATAPALMQTVVLAPGGYRLDVRGTLQTGGTAAPIGWTLTCLRPGVSDSPTALPWRIVTRPRGTADGIAEFTIPPTCPAQRLALIVHESGGLRTVLQINNIDLHQM